MGPARPPVGYWIVHERPTLQSHTAAAAAGGAATARATAARASRSANRARPHRDGARGVGRLHLAPDASARNHSARRHAPPLGATWAATSISTIDRATDDRQPAFS